MTNTTQGWAKQPAISAGSKGCVCCGAMHQALEMDALIGVGFGDAGYSRNGTVVWNEATSEHLITVADAERAAKADPDHDWRIFYYAPLYEAVYQRQSEGHWVLIEKGEGFA